MTVTTYSKRSIWIHWFSAILIFATVPTGLAMSETVASESKLLLYQIHFVIGALVFVLAIFHVYIYFKDARPAAIDTGNKARNQFVSILHRVLTILIFILTITGVGSLFSTPILKAVLSQNSSLLSKYYDSIFVTMHHIQGIVFIVLMLLHIGGVFLHRFTKDKDILARMGINSTYKKKHEI